MRKFTFSCTAAAAAALIAVSVTPSAMAREAERTEGAQGEVAAKAWIAVENPGGKVVAQHNGEERVKVGGFPKLMTALLVARLAAADPKLLDERLEFQSYMVKVPGTKSGAKGGDSMTVRDILYAMLVGSANDASLVLGRHFNDRFAASDFEFLERVPRHSRSFIAEMNRAARQLGMSDTVFRSSYIDGGKKADHTSTAHDMARLSIAVMADPVLREIVGAKSHSATIYSPDGTTRTQSWNNKNSLLGADGVGGILTTGTPSSGQSAIIAKSKGGRSHIIVVLGSDSSRQRFVDAKSIAASIK